MVKKRETELAPTLRGVRAEAKRLVRKIIDGAFPSGSQVEQAVGVESIESGYFLRSRLVDSPAWSEGRYNRCEG
jgi:hypothetical protein